MNIIDNYEYNIYIYEYMNITYIYIYTFGILWVNYHDLRVGTRDAGFTASIWLTTMA